MPNPSIFKASFEIKCFIFSTAIFSHPYPSFVHLLTASYFLVSELNKIENIQCKQPGGAFYVFTKVKKENMNSVEISRYLLEKKFIATVPGSSFGKNGEGFLRISYASTFENLEKFIVSLKDFMNE